VSAASDFRDPIDLQAILAKIDRDRTESEKFVAEQRKLMAEAAKLDRDRRLAPWQIFVTAFTAVLAAVISGGVAVALLGHYFR